MCTIFINRYQIKYFSACKTTVKGEIDDQLAKPIVLFSRKTNGVFFLHELI